MQSGKEISAPQTGADSAANRGDKMV